MRFLLNGAEHKVETYGRHVFVDDTLFTMNGEKWNEVYHQGHHVYTLHFETHTMETGSGYQTWYDEDQIPVRFEDWAFKRNIKNIIIDDIVYQVEGAAALWPRPKLFLREKHVGYIREDELVWIGENGTYLQKVIR